MDLLAQLCTAVTAVILIAVFPFEAFLIDRPWVQNGLDAPAPLGNASTYAAPCWARQALGNPERCMTERPEDHPREDGRVVACHFEEQIPALAAAETAR